MAIDARLIQSNLNTALQQVRPADNLLTGFQTGQGLVQNQQNLMRGDLQNQALGLQVQNQAELAPLEQEVRGAQLQGMLDDLGAPDVPTAKEIAFNVSKLSALPDAQVPDQINRMISNAQIAGRTTENLDELLSVYQQDPVRGRELLNAGVQAFQQTGLLETQGGTAQTAEEQTFNNLIKDFTPEQKKEARLVKARLKPGAVGSAIQTIADKGIAEKIGDTEATIAERKKFGELTGSSRSKAIDKGFESIQNIDKNLGNIDKAIAAIDEGAQTGAIESRFFPSFKAATIKLEQIQKELGLDVISSVSFGALSEGELDLALNTALPTGLEPAELRTFLTDKKAAQSKLRAYYREQMDFLDDGGSVSGFLRQKERSSGGSGAQGNTITLPNGVVVGVKG